VQRPRRATITDVAAEAGVAASTVSRSFTNPARVNQHTRAHVLDVAARLGYAPNPVAQALESGRSNTVALVVPDIANPFFVGFVKGAERTLASSQRTLVLADGRESAVAEEAVVQRLHRAVDGFVLVASRMDDDALRRAAGLAPVVLVNRVTAGLASVVADYVGGAEQIVSHLASLGHRRLVVLGGPSGSWSAARRWTGVRVAADRHGVTAVRLGPFQPTFAAGAAAADAALAEGSSAVVAHNDLLAMGVMARLAQRGVQVPEQVSVVGFDDIFGAALCSPALTTLAERAEESGALAVEALLEGGPSVGPGHPPQVTPTHLVVRGSTAQAAAAGQRGAATRS
jgi:LacI family transcriptional regulator, repressor for deo operon, udp, cdd, tsx, nupC, and nupG